MFSCYRNVGRAGEVSSRPGSGGHVISAAGGRSGERGEAVVPGPCSWHRTHHRPASRRQPRATGLLCPLLSKEKGSLCPGEVLAWKSQAGKTQASECKQRPKSGRREQCVGLGFFVLGCFFGLSELGSPCGPR